MPRPRIHSLFLLLAGLLLGAGMTGAAASLLGSARFSDVPEGSYYDGAVGEMAELQVIRGRPDGRFDPSAFATRAEIAVMLKRLRDDILGNRGERAAATDSSRSGSRSLSPLAPEPEVKPLTPLSRNPAGSFRFSIDAFDTAEYAGTATINILRTGGKEGAVSVTFALEDGAAKGGEDYESMTKTVTFADNESSRLLLVKIMDDGIGEGNETVQMTLNDPTGGAELGTPAAAILTIRDDDGGATGAGAGGGSTGSPGAGPAAGTVAFSALAYGVAENGEEIVITVERIGGSDGAVTVAYAAADGSALAPHDYAGGRGTLNFAAGATTATFAVVIADDTIIEGKETVRLSLSNPAGGAALGEYSAVTLDIVDDEVLPFGAGSLRFGKKEYEVREDGGGAVFVVERTGGAAGEASVQYKAADRLAKAGQDYSATEGTLTFRNGETKKAFTVPILTDDKDDPDETFIIQLSAQTGGAALGVPEETTVTIVQ